MRRGRRSETDIAKDLAALAQYIKVPRTLAQIQRKFKISRATVYRRLAKIEPGWVWLGNPIRYSSR